MSLKKRNFIIFVISMLLVIVHLQAANVPDSSSHQISVFDEIEGTVIMEMENTDSPLGEWVKRTSLSPFTGNCYLEFMGNNQAGGPPNSPLEYKFRINTEGDYWISIRSHKRLTSDDGVAARHDMCNDCYARVEGDFTSANPNLAVEFLKKDMKFWGGAANLKWTKWTNKVVNKHDIEEARYHFKAGEIYTLVVSGRAQRFSLDRIVITRMEDQRFNEKEKESPRVKVIHTATKNTAVKPQDGDATVSVSGELKQWHKVSLDLAGPYAEENNDLLNPFTDLRFDVIFEHETGQPSYTVPGYFAADGDAANSSATSGSVWRAHLSPDKTGKWNYRISFRKGKQVAINGGGEIVSPYNGISGSFTIEPTDKAGRDFRGKGRLTYTGIRYLKHAGTGEVFIKAGPDSPETILAYTDFDGTVANKKNAQLKTWEPHVKDWKEGDPTWKDKKGKGLNRCIELFSRQGCKYFFFFDI